MNAHDKIKRLLVLNGLLSDIEQELDDLDNSEPVKVDRIRKQLFSKYDKLDDDLNGEVS